MDLLPALFMVLQCQHVYDLLVVANLPDAATELFQKSSDRLGRAFAGDLDITLRARMSLQPGLMQELPFAKRVLALLKLDCQILSAVSRFDVVNVIFATKFEPGLLATHSELPGVRALYDAYIGQLLVLVERLNALGLLSVIDDSAEQVGGPIELHPGSGAPAAPQSPRAPESEGADMRALWQTMQRGQMATMIVRGRLIELDGMVSHMLTEVPSASAELADPNESFLDREISEVAQLLELLDRFFAELQPVIEPFCQQLGVPGLADAVGRMLVFNPRQSQPSRRGQSWRGDPLNWLLNLQGALTALLQHHSALIMSPLPLGPQQAAQAMTVTIAGSRQEKGVVRTCRGLLLGSAKLEADLRRVSPSRRLAENTLCGKLLWRAYEVQAALITSAVVLTVELVFAQWLMRQHIVKFWQPEPDQWVRGLTSFLADSLETIARRFPSRKGSQPNTGFVVAGASDSHLPEAYLRQLKQEGLAFTGIYSYIATARHIGNQLIRMLNEGKASSLQEAASDEYDEFLKLAEQQIDPLIATLTAINIDIARIMRDQGFEDLAGVLDRLIPVN